MVKCFAFIDCLPDEEKARAKYFPRREHVGFEDLCQRFRDDNQGILPRYPGTFQKTMGTMQTKITKMEGPTYLVDRGN